MTEFSWPWQGIVTGDATLAPYSSAEWSSVLESLAGSDYDGNYSLLEGTLPTGVQAFTDIPLYVTPTAPASRGVSVNGGHALVQGTLYQNDAVVSLPVAINSSGSARWDTVILRKDSVAQTIRLAILQGTPGTGIPATLTQTAATWEVPIAWIYLANGYVTITEANIVLSQLYVNQVNRVVIPSVENGSGGILRTGDVVCWSTANGRTAVTTTTQNDKRVAGAWLGWTPNGGIGAILRRGPCVVRLNEAFVGAQRGKPIIADSNAGVAIHMDGTSYYRTQLYKLGIALGTANYQTNVGIGLAGADIKARLCYIDVDSPGNTGIATIREFQNVNVAGGGLTSGDARFDTAVSQVEITNPDQLVGTSGTSGYVLQKGNYRVRCTVVAYQVNNHKVKIIAAAGTISPTTLVGSNAHSPAADGSMEASHIDARFAVTSASATLQVLHYCQTNKITNGRGLAVNLGGLQETYAIMTIEREDEGYL